MLFARILCSALRRLGPWAGVWLAAWAVLFATSAPAVILTPPPKPGAGAAAAQVPQKDMPPLIGMRLEAAQARLAQEGLQQATPTRVASPSPAGTVIGQDPQRGTKVTSFTAIRVTVSRGPDPPSPPPPPPPPPVPQQLMPNLVGMTEAQARLTLQQRDLRQPSVGVGPGTCPGGAVINQRPRANQFVTATTPITVQVADGTTRVPTITGRTPSSAQARLAQAGLRLGAGSEAQVSGPSGLIVRSNPPAGQTIACGGAVAYVVAGTPPPKTMPNVLGGMLNDASAILAGVSLQVGQTFEAQSTQPRGEVVSQQPPAGQTIQPSTFVRLGLSDGSTRVPALIGRTPAEAGPILQAAGLAAGERTQQPSTGPSGRILSTTPAAGALVPRGSAVGYVVATPQPRPVPNVVGASEAVARQRLVDAGFRPLTQAGDDLEDRVARQDPAAGSTAAIGSRVSLTLAKRPPPPNPTVPNVVGATAEAATRSLEAAGFRAAMAAAGPGVQQVDSVASQDPAAGVAAPPGAAVTLRLAQAPPPDPDPPPPARVPRVEDESEADAVRILQDAGYQAEVSPTALGYWPTGRVRRQFPEPDAAAPRGSTVTLVLAVTTVPTLAGGAAVLAGLLAAGWFGTWPMRIAIRPGVTGLSPPAPDDRDLDGAAGFLMSWSIEDDAQAYGGAADDAALGLAIELSWSVEVGEHEGFSEGDET